MFSKVDAKYNRLKETVQMENMLSRGEHKSIFNLEPQIPKIPIQRALDQFGYTHQTTTEKELDIHEVHNKVIHKRPDKCIFGFEKILPRKHRQSIYAQNDGIHDSCVVDPFKVMSGRDNLTFLHDPKPMHFRYEKPVEEQDLNNDSQNLYMKIVKSRVSVDYLRKVMEKKGVLKEAKNPLKGTRFE